jgi:hypothetical protein
MQAPATHPALANTTQQELDVVQFTMPDTHFREGVTSAAAARGISMLVAAAAVRPAVNCRDTGLLSFWALRQQNSGTAQICCSVLHKEKC